MKILVLRFSSIGDIVLTSPVVRNLKNKFPNSEIHFCTKKKYSVLFESNPFISKVYFLEKKIINLGRILRREKYDVVIDLHSNLRTRIIKLCLFGMSKLYTFKKLNFKKWVYVVFKINRLPPIHIVDRYMNTLSSMGVENDGLGLDYFIPEKDHVLKQSLPVSFQDNYVVYALGGQHETKKLPFQKIVELCLLIKEPIVFLGAKEDYIQAQNIIDHFQQQQNKPCFPLLYNGCGLYNLNQSASLLKQSAWVIAHDTGLMHIAAAFKKKIYSIWGNTVPDFGMYPYQTEYVVWENKGLYCRPCSKIGYSVCPKGHFRCMNDIIFKL